MMLEDIKCMKQETLRLKEKNKILKKFMTALPRHLSNKLPWAIAR